MNMRLKDWTDKDKWLCTVRWLNAMYLAFWNHELISDGENFPCADCPNQSRCPTLYVTDNLADDFCICEHFKILEQFTGPGTVVGPLFPKPKWDTTEHPNRPEDMDNQPMDICPLGQHCSNVQKESELA